MKRKNIRTIGLSLLIALAFILPTGAIMAVSPAEYKGRPGSSGQPEAGEYNKQDMDAMQVNMDMALKMPGDAPQDSEVGVTGAVVENPDEEQLTLVDGSIIPLEDFYKFFVEITNYGPDDTIVKPHMELYEIGTTPNRVLMYETSFEDNYDIYNHWIQVDGDCAVTGGHYDSWVRSDARASDGDYAMHSTMYPEYKASQDDYLEMQMYEEPCDGIYGGLDATGQDFVELKFDVWVEGEGVGGSYYHPYDFLNVQVYDSGSWYFVDGLTLYNPLAADSCDHYEYPNYVYADMWFVDSQTAYLLSGGYYFFDTTLDGYDTDGIMNYLQYTQTAKCHPEPLDIGGGWWQVQLTLPVSWWWDETDVRYRFWWHSDVENQFEGAYVDNIRIYSLEDTYTKIFQSHSQGEVEWVVGDHYFEFPLAWNDVAEGNYRLKLWVENHAGTSLHDMTLAGDTSYVIDFTVGDDIDCEIIDYDGTAGNDDLFLEDSFTLEQVHNGGLFSEGADAHVKFDFHNDGNLPVSDVEITATARKITWETVSTSDFEGLIWGDSGSFGDGFYDDAENLWHKTTTDAWTGSSSLACFDKQTMNYHNNMYHNYILGPSVDMEGVIESKVDYYAKWITAGPEDYVNFLLHDPATNYILGCGSPYSFDGFQPTWIGPDQPQGIYQPFNLKAYYDLWYGNGMFRNADGSQSTDVTFGFDVWDTDSEGVTNLEAEHMDIYWSGWYFDDVVIKNKVLGDVVWQDTMIIPETIEPCEHFESQFEWEDVPYSCYRITISTNCEEAITCCPEDNNAQSIDFCVMDGLEVGTKLESVDMTEDGNGEWCISSGGMDYYLATQCDASHYVTNANQVAQLCIENDGDCEGGCSDACILDVSHLVTMSGGTIFNTIFLEDFETGAAPGWTNINVGAGFGWMIEDYGLTSTFEIPSTGTGTYFANIDSDASGGGEMATFQSPLIDLTAGGLNPGTTVTIEYDVGWNNFAAGPDFGTVTLTDGMTSIPVALYDFSNDPTNGHESFTVDFGAAGMMFPTSAWLEFYYDDVGTWAWNFAIDNVAVGYLSGGAPVPDLDMQMFFDIWYDTEYDWDYAFVEVLDYDLVGPDHCDENVNWAIVDVQTGYAPYDYGLYSFPWTIAGTLDADNWVRGHGIDFGILQDYGYITGSNIGIRFRFQSDNYYMDPGYGYGELRGVRIDNVFIEDLIDVTDITDPEPVFEDLLDPMCDLTNWCLYNIHYGQFWTEVSDTEYCTTFPADPILDALVWETEIADAYVAELTLEADWDLGADEHGTYARIEISADGGDNWFILDKLFGTSGGYVELGPYDLTSWAGNDVLIRFIVDGVHADMAMWLSLIRGYSTTYPGPNAGFLCVNDIQIYGKQDTMAPNSEISMSGTMSDLGWYTSAVQCTITATDDNAVGEIHYILDGSEKVVAGDTASFTVSGNGDHTLEFWAIDVTGNVETPHNTVPAFRIDSGSPPSVAITAPEPGLYLFGNKLLSLSKVMIIGAFTVEATASDAESGVYKVQFLLDGDEIAEDTEAPYSAYVAVKHMGAGTLTAVAEDFSGNSAEDTLDITYYKFL